MPASLFDDLSALNASAGSSAMLDRLIAALREEGRYHKLFDARMLRRKLELGLPLSRPASLADVPQPLRKQVEETYVDAAREVGKLFLDSGDIPSAWMYYQVIREPGPVREAIEALPLPASGDESAEQLVRIALYEGVHPTRGVQMMLRLHGTCSTITSLDQALANLPQADRRACARIVVQDLYRDLRDNVERDVQRRMAMLPPATPLRELIAGRDWLFEGGNYHIDVSHLSSVVRFGRSLESPEDLEIALQLAEYGSHLDPQLQYGGDPPFDDFYPAHIQFFRALLNRDRDTAIAYFREKLEQEPDERDRPLLAYVLVDLLMRTEQLDAAVDVASEYLANLGEEVSLSLFDLCVQAGRFETLRQTLRAQEDPVGYAAALAAESARPATA